jgi:hypothetical protein
LDFLLHTLLKRIVSPEEQGRRALKALRLNGDSSPDYNPRLLAASSTKKKPTIRIKRLSFSGQGIKLKGASSLHKAKEKAQKALRLNGIV